MKKRTTGDWIKRLDEAEIPNGVVNDFQDLLVDEYLAESRFFRRMQHPTEGKVVSMAVPVSFSKTAASIHRLAPRLGEHTEEILNEVLNSPQRKKSH